MKKSRLSLWLVAWIGCQSLGLATVARAQACADSGLDVGASLRSTVTRCADEKVIYRLAAVTGERSIPELKALVEGKLGGGCARLNSVAQVALAKLGDEAALRDLAHMLESGTRSSETIKLLSLVGDDRAISVLMTYLVRHQTDGSLLHNYGDYVEDERREIVKAMREISSRRVVPDLPAGIPFPGELLPYESWVKWWQRYGGSSISRPAYAALSDPVLQCLARKVDWGFPDAILEIGRRSGKEAETALRGFPRGPNGLPMGTVEGNLEAALAKLGDSKQLAEVVAGLSGEAPETAVAKLRYIGGKSAVGALVAALGAPIKVLERTKIGLDRHASSPERTLYQQNYNVFDRENREYQQSLLRALASMVGNPPLGGDAVQTPANFQRWKDWWAQNQDHVQFVQPAPVDHE